MCCRSILSEVIRHHRLGLIDKPVMSKLIDVKWAQFAQKQHIIDVWVTE